MTQNIPSRPGRDGRARSGRRFYLSIVTHLFVLVNFFNNLSHVIFKPHSMEKRKGGMFFGT